MDADEPATAAATRHLSLPQMPQAATPARRPRATAVGMFGGSSLCVHTGWWLRSPSTTGRSAQRCRERHCPTGREHVAAIVKAWSDRRALSRLRNRVTGPENPQKQRKAVHRMQPVSTVPVLQVAGWL